MEKLGDFINNINSVLESLYIEIKRGLTEDDGRPVYALVSVAQSPLVALVRTGTDTELAALAQPCPMPPWPQACSLVSSVLNWATRTSAWQWPHCPHRSLRDMEVGGATGLCWVGAASGQSEAHTSQAPRGGGSSSPGPTPVLKSV